MPENIIRDRRLRPSRRSAAALVSALAVFGGALAASPAVAAAPPAAEIVLTVAPVATEGETITVVASASDAVDLYAYDLVLAYDPALLAVVEGSASGPDGGFTAATTRTGEVTVSHTRRGTSPGLAGSMELGSVDFTVLDGGTATIALPRAVLVSAANESAVQTDAASAAIELTALAEPPVGTDPGTDPGADPGASPVTGPESADSGSGSSSSDPLAATGADVTPWLISGAVAAVLVAVGALLVFRRRSAVTE